MAEIAAIPKLPAVGAHLWDFFQQLSNFYRGSNGMSLQRLTSADIDEWLAEEGEELERWERLAIRRIDRAWLVTMSKTDDE